MSFEPVPEPKRPRVRLQRLTADLSRDWEFTLSAFESYRELPPHKKYRALGIVIANLLSTPTLIVRRKGTIQFFSLRFRVLCS